MKNCNSKPNQNALIPILEAGSLLFNLDTPLHKRTVTIWAKLASLGIEVDEFPVVARQLLTTLDNCYRDGNEAAMLQTLMDFYKTDARDYLAGLLWQIIQGISKGEKAIVMLNVATLWYSLLPEFEQQEVIISAAKSHAAECAKCSAVENSLFGYPSRVKTLTEILYGEAEHSTLGILQ